MCGIAGFFGTGDLADIQAMTAALLHRGPDDGGIFSDDGLFMGHRRLSILDIADGNQPMSVSTYTLVYNGELYNHPQLRRELESEGIVFRTSHSDTETMLQAFRHWGPDCFIRFNGMFACAIYDKANRKLWLARDRFGEKPLFYLQNSQGFAFASEPGALRLWPGFKDQIDNGNLQRFFAWNYLPGARCLYSGCQSLKPGTWLCFDLATMKQKKHIWWQYTLNPDESLTDEKEEELAEELRRLLLQAVSRRLLSDVPLGIFLSGGIDSGTVLAAACKIAGPDAVRSFTIGFRETSFDESEKAKAVAEWLGAPNFVKYLTEEDMTNSISTILGKMGEPFGDASLIPTWHLANFARQNVTVALSGDGGDELFGGYDPLAAIAPALLYRKFMPGPIHFLLRKAISLLPASDKNMSLDFKLKRVLRGLSWPEAIQLPIWMSGLDPEEIGAFFKDPLDADELFKDALNLWHEHEHLSGIAQALLFFTRIYLPDDILVKTDRASMMVSLETRAVFLDNDLADFCSRLPLRFKYRNGQRKYLLKKAVSAWLPPQIIKQRKKGFGIPLNRWLRALPAPTGRIPGLKPGVLEFCDKLHKKRKGDFRFFLWDAQAYERLAI